LFFVSFVREFREIRKSNEEREKRNEQCAARNENMELTGRGYLFTYQFVNW